MRCSATNSRKPPTPGAGQAHRQIGGRGEQGHHHVEHDVGPLPSPAASLACRRQPPGQAGAMPHPPQDVLGGRVPRPPPARDPDQCHHPIQGRGEVGRNLLGALPFPAEYRGDHVDHGPLTGAARAERPAQTSQADRIEAAHRGPEQRRGHLSVQGRRVDAGPKDRQQRSHHRLVGHRR